MKENTKIIIDLEEELTEVELKSFKSEAKQAGAKSLKEHFINITIRDRKGEVG